MTSIPEERNIIVQRCIPKLIASLTGFNPKEENFKLCHQFAWSHFKHHRFLSCNAHEVKRDIEGICEKLKLNNFHEEEKQFRKIVEETLTHELAVNHYEKDVMYAIVNLLTTLAYNPINRIKDKKRRGIPIFPLKAVKSIDKKSSENQHFIDTLLKDNFVLAHNETDSELSEWTESEDDEVRKSTSESEQDETQTKTLPTCSLRPPQKPPVFDKVILENSEKWLKENIENSWWAPNIITKCDINSSHPAANFCLDWQRHLTNRSLGFIKPQPVSLLTEYCLLREIFWMFSNATDCKFFIIENEEINLRKNVSLPSTSIETLQIFLGNFLRSMNIVNHLKKEIQKSYKSATISHTLENYYGTLKAFLDEILEFIIEQESILRAQEQTYTIITLHNNMRPHAKILELLWNIHTTSVLDVEKYPPHIYSSYLIASLNDHVHNSSSKQKKNLAVTLLITCLSTYFKIFNAWWTEARLHDFKMEFLVEKFHCNDAEIIQPRLFEKCKEKAFFVNENISNRITSDAIISIMKYYAAEASLTLEIISKLDRIHEMKQIGIDSKNLCEEFMELIEEEIAKLASNNIENEIEESPPEESKNQKIIDDIKKGMIDDGDEMMLLVFKSTFDNLSITRKKKKSLPLEIFKSLNKATDSLLLPLEVSIERIIKELLSKKISIAEKFVMDIYLNEFMIENYLHEIRKVFFLESNQLMSFFNLKLFPQMESGDSSWTNSYMLTIFVNEAICCGRQENLFTVQVNKKLGHHSVLDAIDEITIHVNVNHNLDNVFTSSSIKKYNEVFRFLLKIKWGQRILNCLQFPEFFKRRQPYAKLQMLDLVIKRLSITRFSMQHAINTIHNHLLVTLQALSIQLNANLSKAQKITELINCHNSFVDAFHRKALMSESTKRTRGIIKEMLKLARVVKDEWQNISNFHALDSAGKIDDSLTLAKLNANTIEIEKAFKACVETELKNLLDY